MVFLFARVKETMKSLDKDAFCCDAKKPLLLLDVLPLSAFVCPVDARLSPEDML